MASRPPPLDAEKLNEAILALATGEPELVMVDARVLRVLLGPLADLILMAPVNPALSLPPDEEPFVWDDDDPC